MILNLISLIAVDIFISGMIYTDVQIERLLDFTLSIAMISGVIIYFIQFIKKNLRDIDKSQKEAEEKTDRDMGEVVQLVVFSVIILMPIWKIPAFINIYNNMIESKELVIEIGKAFGYSFLGIVLMLELNPLDIKKRISRKKKFY